jgi:hypothetical protein
MVGTVAPVTGAGQVPADRRYAVLVAESPEKVLNGTAELVVAPHVDAIAATVPLVFEKAR